MSTAARFGLLLPTREDAITGADAHPRRLIDLAVRAERDGFDSVWVGDSLLARPRLEPLTVLGAVASHTTSVAVGTAALTGVIRHPVLAAHTIATVDRLSEGRLVLALGAGFPYPDTEAELAAAGVPFDGRVRRLLDVVDLWRSLWGDHPPDDLAALPRPARVGGPPLWYAGAGDAAVDRVARRFDGWLPYVPTAEDYRIQARRLRARLREGDVGRSVTSALYVTVRVDDDGDRARRDLDEYCTRYYGAPLELMEALQGFVIGTASEVADQLGRFVRAGAEHVVVRVGSLRPSQDDVDLVGEVVARVRSAEAPDLSGEVDEGVPAART